MKASVNQEMANVLGTIKEFCDTHTCAECPFCATTNKKHQYYICWFHHEEPANWNIESLNVK